MVAQFNRETFAPTLLTPGPSSTDPDDVRLALETARAFQGMGEMEDAIEWLERAAERSVLAGQHERAIVLLQAMAKLMNRNAPGSRPVSPSPSRVEKRDRGSVTSPAAKLPPCPPSLHAGVSHLPSPRTSSILPPPPRKSLPPACKSPLPVVPMLSLPATAAPRSAESRSDSVDPSSVTARIAPVSVPPTLQNDASTPQGPPRASVPPKRSSGVMANPVRAASSAKTIRAAITGLVAKAGSFTIERLAKGQAVPAGTVEATLTLSDDERTIKVVTQR